jgi:hypothetical protein
MLSCALFLYTNARFVWAECLRTSSSILTSTLVIRNLKKAISLPRFVVKKEEEGDDDFEGDEEEGDEEEGDEEEVGKESKEEEGGKESKEENDDDDKGNEPYKVGKDPLDAAWLTVAMVSSVNVSLKAQVAELEAKLALNAAGSPAAAGSPYVLRSATAASIASPTTTVVTTPTFTPPTGAVAMKHQKTLDATMFNIEETVKDIEKEHSGRYTELYMLGVFINQYKDAAPHDAAEQKSFSRFIGNKDVDFDTMKATKCTPTPSVAGTPAAGS